MLIILSKKVMVEMTCVVLHSRSLLHIFLAVSPNKTRLIWTFFSLWRFLMPEWKSCTALNLYVTSETSNRVTLRWNNQCGAKNDKKEINQGLQPKINNVTCCPRTFIKQVYTIEKALQRVRSHVFVCGVDFTSRVNVISFLFTAESSSEKYYEKKIICSVAS